jgi:hypothetical protein
MAVWAGLLAVPFFALRAGAYTFAALVLAVEVCLYVYSLAFRQWVPCLVCGGTGTRHHSGLMKLLWPDAFGACWKCKGARGKVRAGIRWLAPGRARDIRSRGR